MPMPALAGPFDGKWFADIPAQNRCNSVSSMELVVADGQIMGKIHNPANVVSVSGKVEDNGDANFIVNRPGSSQTWSGTMKFHNDRFEATWFNGGCDRHAEGNRAPSPEQQAAMAADRNSIRRLTPIWCAAPKPVRKSTMRSCAPNMSMPRTGISMAARSMAWSPRPMPPPRARTARPRWKRWIRYCHWISPSSWRTASDPIACRTAITPAPASNRTSPTALNDSLMDSGDGDSRKDCLCRQHAARGRLCACSTATSSSRPARPKCAAATAIIMTKSRASRSAPASAFMAAAAPACRPRRSISTSTAS